MSQRPIGQTLANKYRVEALIGAGGFGRVYRCRHLALGEDVAVKILRRELAADPTFRERFRREAIALSRLRHPGIAVVHDYGADGEDVFIVMEYLVGRVLGTLLRPGLAPLSYERIGHIAEQVLEVLEAAHGQGIIHRDIKPDNIMLIDPGDRTERVKVLDFGLALLSEPAYANRLTVGALVQGTPSYLSPEQCRGEGAVPASDIYAVGVMLFEMLAGVTPFVAETTTDLMVRHVYVDPPALCEVGLRRQPPAALESLVRGALAKHKEDRPTAAALRAALLRWRGAHESGEEPSGSAAGEGAERTVPAGSAPLLRVPPDADPGSELSTVPIGTSAAAVAPTVVLWDLPAARSISLRDALAVHGVAGILHYGDDLPPQTDPEARVVVIGPADEGRAAPLGPVAKVQALRAAAGRGRVPVLAVDMGATDTPPLIRAGVSDIALHPAADAALCQKVWRLILRGR